MPPPRVSPPTPVVEMMPPVVASPNGYVAEFRSPHVAPPETRAVWVRGSTRTPRMADRSMTTPPSHVPKPGTLWPPPRTATVSRVVGSETYGGHHVSGVDRLDDEGRALVDHAVADRARDVVPLVIGSGDSPPDLLAQSVKLSIHAVLLMAPPVASGDEGVERASLNCADSRQVLAG